MKLHPLKAWRIGQGLTQTEAAHAVGVTKQCWSLWESGARLPHSPHMRVIMKCCGVKPDQLYAAAAQ